MVGLKGMPGKHRMGGREDIGAVSRHEDATLQMGERDDVERDTK